jgi:GNAT superfamily N-acetyltransferase
MLPDSTQTPDCPAHQPSYAQRPRIALAPASAADDTDLVNLLVNIVNAVYRDTEGELFVDSYQRTDADEMQRFIKAGEVVIAYQHADFKYSEAVPIGCIRIQRLSETHGEFGMMAVDVRYHGGGFGREMVRFAEDHCRSLDLSVMQLELLFPQQYEHVFKKRLRDWYLRMGYRLVRLGIFQDDYPHIAALLRCPCEYRVFEKPLA